MSLILSATTHSLEVTTTGTGAVHVECSFTDDLAGVKTQGSQVTTISSATTTTVVSAPAASTTRTIDELTVLAVAANGVMIKKDISAVETALLGPLTLALGERAQFVSARGWRVFEAQGAEKVGTAGSATVPTGTGFRHVTAGSEDVASKLVDTADINPAQVTYAKIQNVGANSIPCNPTGSAAVAQDLAVTAESLVGRSGGLLTVLAAAVQSAFIRSAGSLFNVTFAAGQHLRRSIAGGDLGASALEVGAMGTPLVANNAATNATTNLSCGTFTTVADSLVVGSTFKFTGYFTYVHTAVTTNGIIAELLVNGAVVATATTAISATAITFSGIVEGYLTIRTTGASGTALPAVRVDHLLLPVNGQNGSAVTTAFTFNTTVTRSLEMRIRMAGATLSNTLTVTNGFIERLG